MSPPAPSKILLFGATGVIGKFILTELISAQPAFSKIGIFTSSDTASQKSSEIAALKEKGVEIVVGDVNSADAVNKAFEGFDTVVSALGRNAILAQIPLLDLAEASSTIHTFYPSEYGTDIEYGPSSPTEKPHQLKLKVRAHIRDKITKLNITYLVTGPYSDLYISKPPDALSNAGSFDVSTKKATLLGTGNERVSFTTMRDVGVLLASALHTPATASPRVLKVNSFTTTPAAILAEFEKQTNAKWQVDYTSLPELKKRETEAWENESPAATVITLRRIWTEGGTLYSQSDNKLIGEPQTETLEEQVAKAVQKGSL